MTLSLRDCFPQLLKHKDFWTQSFQIKTIL